MKLYIHSLAQAQFAGSAVGTVVRDEAALLGFIGEAVRGTVFPENGQGFLPLPADANPAVAAGVARRSKNPGDYVPREHRGEVGLYLRRDTLAAVNLDPDGVAAIVYTAAAYEADPQITEAEKAAFAEEGHTHALITILAFKGPKPPVGPERFVANLAGGNNAALAASADEIRAEARAVQEYFRTWCVVG